MIFNLKIAVSTFLLIFLAELGDKTQITTFAFASREKAGLSVFLGAASALVLTSLIAVLIGEAVGKFIPVRITKLTAGILFLAFGIWTIIEVIKG